MEKDKGTPVYHPLRPLIKKRGEAAHRALKSLAGYNFVLFGFWAGMWVHINKCITSEDASLRSKNPFGPLVKAARKIREETKQNDST